MSLLKPFEVDYSGINLVEASAGTGKTYNIMSLYIRAVIEKELSVNKILVVTYTEAATKELKDGLLQRIRKSISVLQAGEVTGDDRSDQFLNELLEHITDREKAIARLEQAVRMFDESAIYTIHGFCYQTLQEQAFESRAMYDAEMIGEDTELVQEAVDDYWRKWMAEASDDAQKHPILMLFEENGVGPESLTNELGNYIGKPYLHVLPEDAEITDFKDQLQNFVDVYDEIQRMWQENRERLFELLNTGILSGYTENKLNKWFGLMDEFLKADVPRFETFTQFYRFKQSEMNEGLKKKPMEEGKQPPEHPFFTLIDEYVRIKESVKSFEVAFKKELLQYLRIELNEKKEELQVLSYDDLLLRLRNALLDAERGQKLAEKMCRKYPVAMVDEFQDTDPNQYDIFRRIYRDSEESALFMIGDPKQSIYSFRGADVYSYIKARKDAPKKNRFRLRRNFRSVPNLLEGLNTIWGSHANPFVIAGDIEYQEVEAGKADDNYDSLLEYGKDRPAIRFRRLSEPGQDKLKKGDARKQAAKDTAREIARLLEGGKKRQITIGGEPVEAKDIAVLVRKHKQADLISKALEEHAIKSVRHSDQSVFESDEAKQLEQLLKAVAEPSNETFVKTALSLPLSDYTALELLEIEDNEHQWIELLDQFAEWHRRWQEQGFAAMFRSLMAKLNTAEHVISYGNGERRLTNLLHLGELLQAESRYHKEGSRSLIQWLARKRQEHDNSKRDEDQIRLESDEELVKVVTMHKSKGLQYPIVFCPFLWDGPYISDGGEPLVYHHIDDHETTYLDLHGKADPDRAQKRFYAQREKQAESMRLAYVAMTRAQQCLYLTWQFASSSQLSSLGYLLQDPNVSESQLKDKVNVGDAMDWSRDDYHEAIGKLCEEYPKLFTFNRPSEISEGSQLELSPIQDTTDNFKSRRFRRSTPLEVSYHVSSFSSLTSWMEDDPEMPDYDQFLDGPDIVEVAGKDDPKTMFNFPKGPQPGTCIHDIFENIDFADLTSADKVIRKSLSTYGIDQKWSGTVQKMLEVVVHKSLHPQSTTLSLSALDTNDVIPEMEFYYQNEHIEAQNLVSIIRDKNPSDLAMGGEAESGFLKGFIDLTFEFDGRYYLLDYKTNFLGDSVLDYKQSHLSEEMQEASYDLQYHIYTIALHRFLKQRKPGYSYEEHFGGAFYLFLRGMNQEGNEGIFFDRPNVETIEKLDAYIKIGGGNA